MKAPSPILGDFNKVLYDKDKFSSSFTLAKAIVFENVIFQSGLLELKAGRFGILGPIIRKG